MSASCAAWEPPHWLHGQPARAQPQNALHPRGLAHRVSPKIPAHAGNALPHNIHRGPVPVAAAHAEEGAPARRRGSVADRLQIRGDLGTGGKAKAQIKALRSYLVARTLKKKSSVAQVNDLIHIADGAFNRSQILAAEKAILNSMEWNLTVPTPYHFLLRFAKAAGSADEQVKIELLFCSLFCSVIILNSCVTADAASAYDKLLWRARADGLRYGDDQSFDGGCLRCVRCSPHVGEESSLDRDLEAPHWPQRAADHVSCSPLHGCCPSEWASSGGMYIRLSSVQWSSGKAPRHWSDLMLLVLALMRGWRPSTRSTPRSSLGVWLCTHRHRLLFPTLSRVFTWQAEGFSWVRFDWQVRELFSYTLFSRVY